nr:MAG TPA: protein of unknown function (DUF4355) [Caudoviricetes sp.]
MEFKAITTQEEFDKAIAERLKRQKESIFKEFEDYEQIKKERDNLQNELIELKKTSETYVAEKENHSKELEELNNKIKDYELNNMRMKIAIENNIPYSLADRLKGDDEESLANDAKSLAEFVSKNKNVAPLKSTEPKVDVKNASYKKLLENLEQGD